MSKDFVFGSQMKRNGGYYYDIITNTLHITKEFERKAERYGTAECKVMDELMLNTDARPFIEVHINKRKPRLSFKMMEIFISKMPNAKTNFVEYECIRKKSKIARNPHKEVLDWFEKKFPYYQKLMVVQDGDVIWNALDEYRKALEAQSKRGNNIIQMPEKTEEKELRHVAD